MGESFKVIMIVAMIIGVAIMGMYFLSTPEEFSTEQPRAPAEQPHLYWKTAKATVEKIDYRHWYASGHHYTCDITIHNEDYDLTESFHLTFADAHRMEGVRKGDVIEVTINTLKMDSTGRIVERYIGSIK